MKKIALAVALVRPDLDVVPPGFSLVLALPVMVQKLSVASHVSFGFVAVTMMMVVCSGVTMVVAAVIVLGIVMVMTDSVVVNVVTSLVMATRPQLAPRVLHVLARHARMMTKAWHWLVRWWSW